MYDLLFRQATIYDGSGSEPYTGDLAVEMRQNSFILDPFPTVLDVIS